MGFFRVNGFSSGFIGLFVRVNVGLSGLDGEVLGSLGEFPRVHGAGCEVDGCGFSLGGWSVGGVG